MPVRRYRYSKRRWRVLVHVLDAVGWALTWPRRLRARRPVPDPRRVLVVQLDHLGDSVLSSPLFPRLRAAFPAARIDVLASASNRAVFEADPHVHEVLVAERNWFERRRGSWAMISAVWGLARLLRRRRYDLALDVRGDVLTILMLALAAIPRRVGWTMGGGGFLLTDVAPWVPMRHEVPSRLALLEAIGIVEDEPPRVTTYVTDRDRVSVGRLFREAWPEPARVDARRAVPVRVGAGVRDLKPVRTGTEPEEPDHLFAGRFGAEAPIVAMHLGAGTAAKRWPLEHWKVLITYFLADGWRVVLVGGPGDPDPFSVLEPDSRILDLSGRLTVSETVAALERADLFVGADSGPAHLASCAGVTSVILFSGTNRAAQWRPWSRQALVLRRRVPCAPCHLKTCPLADHPCLSGLTPDRVHRAARRWWSRTHRAESPHAPI